MAARTVNVIGFIRTAGWLASVDLLNLIVYSPASAALATRHVYVLGSMLYTEGKKFKSYV